jgi:DNA-binding transcriptional LysR family regulator
MHFDLIDLTLFIHVLESSNITAGAAKSCLSLASASARIRGMEASLGIALLERGRRGVIPTAAGKALAQHARLIVQQVERMQADLLDYAQGFKGQIRLLGNTSALNEHLPERIARFLLQHPNIDINLEEHPSLHILHALRHSTADLGIISDAVDASDLQTVAFCSDLLMLITPLDHPLARHASVRFAHSLEYEFVGLGANNAMGILQEEQALHSGRRMKIRVRAEGYDGVMRMVAAGLGLGIVPQAALARFSDSASLRSLALSEPWADRKLLVCARDFSALPTYTKTLVRTLCPATALMDTPMSSPDI